MKIRLSDGDNTMATIVPRQGRNGKRTWQAQVRKKGYPRQTKTFDRKTDAIKWARMVERQMDASTWRNIKGANSLLTANALERYLNEVSIKKRPRTADRDRLSASYLRKAFGSFTLAQVIPDKVAKYRDQRLKKVSPHSVRLELSLLSHLFNTARKEWGNGAIENPVSAIKKPQIPEGRCPMLTNQQIERLLAECKKSHSDYLHPFALLQLHTGCRSSELRGLRWSQVNFEEAFISLIGEEIKNHRRRSIPLTTAAKDIFQSLLEKRSEGIHDKPNSLVFPARGRPDRPRDMHMAFNRAVRRAGLDNLPGAGKLRIHDLRHLCGTYLLMEGADLETVREILGHRDISTTQKYLHVVNEHKKMAINKIGNLGLKAPD
jgi:integrase